MNVVSEYEGGFLEGKRHGQGTLYHPDGSIFRGQFVFGKATGAGVLNLPNGDHIIGDFYQVSSFLDLEITYSKPTP